MSHELNAVRLESVSELSPNEIRSLSTSASMFCSIPYLRFMERMREKSGVWYAAVRSSMSGEIVGILPVYEGGASATSYWDPYAHYLRRAWNSDASGIPSIPSMRFVGIRSGYGWEPHISRALTPDERRQAWELLFASIDGPVAAMFISESGRRELLNWGFPEDNFFLAGATSRIPVGQYQDMGSYIGSLRKPAQARREMRVFSESGAQVDVVPLRTAAARMSPLFVQLGSKYGLSLNAEDEEQEMQALVDIFGDDARAAVLTRDGHTIGGLACVSYQGTLYARQAGFDYAHTGRAFEYFNLAYYELVKYALHCGLAAIDYGQATYKAKVLRGAQIEPLWGFASDEQGNTITAIPEFAAWDRTRRDLLASGQIDLIEKADFP